MAKDFAAERPGAGQAGIERNGLFGPVHRAVFGTHGQQHLTGTDDGGRVARIEPHSRLHVDHGIAAGARLPEHFRKMTAGVDVGRARGDGFLEIRAGLVPLANLHRSHPLARHLTTGSDRLGNDLLLAHRGAADEDRRQQRGKKRTAKPIAEETIGHNHIPRSE